jgi:hypothetical protein
MHVVFLDMPVFLFRLWSMTMAIGPLGMAALQPERCECNEHVGDIFWRCRFQ